MSLSGKILPDARTRTISTPLGAMNRGIYGYNVPIFCVSCGRAGGEVSQDMRDIFWTCNPCHKAYGPITDLMMLPDEVFFKKVEEAQTEAYGRVLSVEEVGEKLKDPESLESLLARDRANLTPHAGS